MIPVFAGARACAWWRRTCSASAAPTSRSTTASYTFDLHRGMLLAFVERLDLRNVMLVCRTGAACSA